jgi:hypothetical protein
MIIGWGMGVGEGVNVRGAILGNGVSVWVGGIGVEVAEGRDVGIFVMVKLAVRVADSCVNVGA